MKDTTTLVINIALLVNERAKLPMFLLVCLGFFARPCRSSEFISVKDQVEDLTVILLSEFTCGIFKHFSTKLFVMSK